MTKVRLSKKLINKISAVIDAGLASGLGDPIPGQMCVEAAICYALDMPHGDEPLCVHPVIRALKIQLNDSCWSTNEARAKGLKRLAILQLNTKDNFDTKTFLLKLKEKFPKHLKRAYADADAYAAAYAAYAADAAYAAADAILSDFASGVEQILIEMNVPAVKYLELLD